MTHAERTAAAIALATEVSAIVGEIILAVIDYTGAETAPTFAIYSETTGRYVVEDLTEEDVIAYAVEDLDLGDAVRADPDIYHPDTVAAYAAR